MFIDQIVRANSKSESPLRDWFLGYISVPLCLPNSGSSQQMLISHWWTNLLVASLQYLGISNVSREKFCGWLFQEDTYQNMGKAWWQPWDTRWLVTTSLKSEGREWEGTGAGVQSLKARPQRHTSDSQVPLPKERFDSFLRWCHCLETKCSNTWVHQETHSSHLPGINLGNTLL